SADRFRVQASPQIPARDTSIRLPTLGDLFHLFGSWQGDFPLGRLRNRLLSFGFRCTVLVFCRALEIMLMYRHADAEVAGREHVCALKSEHQKHVRGPNTDAFYLR